MVPLAFLWKELSSCLKTQYGTDPDCTDGVRVFEEVKFHIFRVVLGVPQLGMS